MNVPKFTEKGFFKTKIPEKSWLMIQDILKNHIDKRIPEYSDTLKKDLKGWIKSENFEVATDLLSLDNFPELKKQVISEMYDLLSEWSGAKLNPNGIVYGIRFYKNGATLGMHVDRKETHHISVNMSVALDGEPWFFDIVDHEGEGHQVLIQPGECVFYESAVCLHGRKTPFNGYYYGNMYCHFTLESNVLP
jgi:prolyl 4-hydroxylase